VVIESWLRTGGKFEPHWAPPALESNTRSQVFVASPPRL
jgi:hypothetical protein